MPISRSVKAGGSTDVQTGQTIVAADLNDDMNTVFAKFDAGIVNADISASAAIAYSKLALTSSIVNGDLTAGTLTNAAINASADIALTKLADTSSTASAAATATDPGVSNSESLATTGDGEIKRLRYAIERLGLGVDATRYDATGSAETTYWGDVPVRNMVWLPGINGVVTSGLPSGWANVNTATLAQEAADSVEGTAGKGRCIKITAAGGDAEGISYTLSGLKASTRYLIVAIVHAGLGSYVAQLVTTGADATSAFRDFTDETSSTVWAPLHGVIQTDATPTDIVVSVLAKTSGDSIRVAWIGYGECASVPLATRVAVVEQQVAATAGTAITGATTDAGLDTNYQFVDDGSNDLDKTVYVPGDAYYIRVTADFNGEETTATQGTKTEVTVRLYQSVGGAALSAVREHHLTAEHDDGATSRAERFSCSMTWIVKAPTPGSSYRYALAATITGNPTLTPQKGNVGESALTVEVVPYGG